MCALLLVWWPSMTRQTWFNRWFGPKSNRYLRIHTWMNNKKNTWTWLQYDRCGCNIINIYSCNVIYTCNNIYGCNMIYYIHGCNMIYIYMAVIWYIYIWLQHSMHGCNMVGILYILYIHMCPSSVSHHDPAHARSFPFRTQEESNITFVPDMYIHKRMSTMFIYANGSMRRIRMSTTKKTPKRIFIKQKRPSS